MADTVGMSLLRLPVVTPDDLGPTVVEDAPGVADVGSSPFEMQ